MLQIILWIRLTAQTNEHDDVLYKYCYIYQQTYHFIVYFYFDTFYFDTSTHSHTRILGLKYIFK